MTDSPTSLRRPVDWRAYAELLRLPNLFTAAADIVMAFLFTHQPPWDDDYRLPLGLLIAASCCLYAAGVALNDYFDRELDAIERPERPIPSGRVAAATAVRLGATLLTLGILLAGAAGAVTCASATRLHGADDLWLLGMRPVAVAAGLAVAVVLYDRLLKATFVGPLGMGVCRGLNVLLGMSVAEAAWETSNYLIAAALATYVIGLTWFARREAGQSRRVQLAAAAAVMAAGIAILAPLPRWVDTPVLVLVMEPQRWWLLLGAMGGWISWRFVYAVARPEPKYVRVAVQSGVLSIIVLDALACLIAWDVTGGMIVLALLIPATLLAQTFAAT